MNPEERVRFEADLAQDRALAAQVRSCRSLLRAFASLDSHAPSAAFPLRVAATLRFRPSPWQRVRRILARRPHRPTAPLPDGFLDDALARLPRHAPAPGFAARVMHGVRLPDSVPARPRLPARPVRALQGAWARLAAAISGLTLGPILAVVAFGQMLFASNAMVTPTNLWSFILDKANTALLGFGDLLLALGAPVLEPLGVFSREAIPSPLLLLGVGAALGLLTAAAIWILYAHLFRSPGPEKRNATV